MSSDLGKPVSDMAAQLQKMKLDTERAAQTRAFNMAQARAMQLARKGGRKVVVLKAP